MPAPANGNLRVVYAALVEHGSVWAGLGSEDWTCPAHDDLNPSLGVAEGTEQPVVLCCQAGCTAEEVMGALDLSMSLLSAPMGTDTARRFSFTYHDEDGVPLFVVVRVERADGSKSFYQYPVDADGRPTKRGKGAMAGVRLVPYQLPQLRRAIRRGDVIYLVAGEKSVHAIRQYIRERKQRLRAFATTVPGGESRKWLPQYTEALNGAKLVKIVADNDPTGYAAAATVFDALQAAGIPAKIVRSATNGRKDDVVEHLNAGHHSRDLVPVVRSSISARRYDKLGRILSRAELAKLPKPEPLIDGWLDLRTTVVVAGESGSNKTFALVGWACSIATGEPWLDFAVKLTSPVVLVVGEGGGGLDDRITAWEKDNRSEVPEGMLTVLLRPPTDLLDDQFWEQLTALARQTGARFIGFDTLSSLSPASDEVKDSAVVLRKMTDLSASVEACVVLVHHTGWENKNRTRGGSQLEANPDNVIIFGRSEDPTSPVSIFRKKNKEGESGLKVWVTRRMSRQSCVLDLADQPATASNAEKKSATDLDVAALDYLDGAGPLVLTRNQLSDALMLRMGVGSLAARRTVQRLLDAGAIATETAPAPEGPRGRLVPRERLRRAQPLSVGSNRNPSDSARATPTGERS